MGNFNWMRNWDEATASEVQLDLLNEIFRIGYRTAEADFWNQASNNSEAKDAYINFANITDFDKKNNDSKRYLKAMLKLTDSPDLLKDFEFIESLNSDPDSFIDDHYVIPDMKEWQKHIGDKKTFVKFLKSDWCNSWGTLNWFFKGYSKGLNQLRYESGYNYQPIEEIKTSLKQKAFNIGKKDAKDIIINDSKTWNSEKWTEFYESYSEGYKCKLNEIDIENLGDQLKNGLNSAFGFNNIDICDYTFFEKEEKLKERLQKTKFFFNILKDSYKKGFEQEVNIFLDKNKNKKKNIER